MFFNSNIASLKNTQSFLKTYAKKDNWHNIDSETGNLGYGWIHYGLIRTLKPKKVLCIGSRYGFIPAICALACKDNNKGIVDFVDANYNQNNPKHKNHWGGVGFWNYENAKKHFGKFKLNDHIKLHIMTSQKFHLINKAKKWEYIYLDGDHSYQGVKKDYKIFWPQLNHNGYLSLHDIFTQKLGNLNYGVSQLWHELKKVNKHNYLEIPGKTGLGIIHKQ